MPAWYRTDLASGLSDKLSDNPIRSWTDAGGLQWTVISRVHAGTGEAICVSLCLRDEETTASVPGACPMARSEAVCSGHSRTRRIGSQLQILRLAKHDKPVPKLIVRARHRPAHTSADPAEPNAEARTKARPETRGANWMRTSGADNLKRRLVGVTA
jgi:hypothetical protein